MKNLKLIFSVFLLLITFQSCTSIKEGFRSQKKNSTDEFLVEKKSPLVMPPEYNELPIPKVEDDEGDYVNTESSNNIEKLITNNEVKTDSSIEKDQNFENSIIDKIKKN